MKILITGGGTREPIDGVRFITNFSTGGTAAALADFFAKQGHEVTFVHGRGSILPTASCHNREYITFADLNQAMMTILGEGHFDAVLHLAAVSDYSVSSIQVGDQVFEPGDAGKLPSRDEVTLKLKPNFKIVDRIKSYARQGAPVLVAFKLTHTPSTEQRLKRITALSHNPEIDLVVHNDLGDRNQGRLKFSLYRHSEPLWQAESLDDLGALLAKFISAYPKV
jgi:phosphopantothenoylcysteine decarboxylase/phosphopantothenate--cysteine ligase